jgi:hypothetical protein
MHLALLAGTDFFTVEVLTLRQVRDWVVCADEISRQNILHGLLVEALSVGPTCSICDLRLSNRSCAELIATRCTFHLTLSPPK